MHGERRVAAPAANPRARNAPLWFGGVMSVDRIVLTVPSRGEYAKAVRMTASGLAARMDMTYDELDDVRIATEEAFVYACDHASESGEVEIEFLVAEESIEVKVNLSDGLRVADEEAERRAAYATFILQSVSDTFEMSSDETGPYLRVVKRVAKDRDDALE
jgi:serine/threonine-protein kinase RsbW